MKIAANTESPLRLRINDPCGRIFCGTGWERTRENSLNLRDWELWLVWRGSGWMRTLSGAHPLFAGFCALMRPGGIYDAGHDENDPLGITFIHFDIEKRQATAHHSRLTTRAAPDTQTTPARHPQAKTTKYPPLHNPPLADGNPADWPEFFLLDDIAYADLLTSRVLGLLDNNLPAATALLHAFLADLLEREPIAPAAWESRYADTSPPSSAAAAAAADSATGKRSAHAALTANNQSAQAGLTTVGGAQRRLPHYRELRQLFARLRTTSPEALPTVAQMAEQMALSPEHFSRLFRSVNGQSPMQFIVSLRINHARHLLRESSLSITEIAEHLGYSDVYFFSRQFKEQTGVPPLSYRRQG